MLDRLSQLFARFTQYVWWEVVLELAVIWAFVFIIFRFVRGTRAAGALKGMLLIVIVGALLIRLLETAGLFGRLTALSSVFLGLAAIVTVVVFQPELRRAFIRLGEANFLQTSSQDRASAVQPIVEAAAFLSKSKFGGIIAIERNTGLREAVENGVKLNAELTAPLLCNIFQPNAPLHDMGVIVRGSRIVAASVPFPLVEPWEMPDPRLGTRHRAALGLARNSDALVVVVSEETGAISLAHGRQLVRWLTPERLTEKLVELLSQDGEEGKQAGAGSDPDAAEGQEAEDIEEGVEQTQTLRPASGFEQEAGEERRSA